MWSDSNRYAHMWAVVSLDGQTILAGPHEGFDINWGSVVGAAHVGDAFALLIYGGARVAVLVLVNEQTGLVTQTYFVHVHSDPSLGSYWLAMTSDGDHLYVAVAGYTLRLVKLAPLP